MTPRFLDVPTFVPQIWEYGNFTVRQSYTNCVAQETRIIRKLLTFNFFTKNLIYF